MRLAGKAALVTGGSRGMGAAIGARLSSEGVSVALTYPTEEDSADQTAEEIRRSGGNAIAIKADNSNAEEVRAAVARTIERFGRLDILVNNAGIGTVGLIDELTLEQFDKIVAVNIRAIFVAVQAALPHLGTGARIINTSSIGSFFSGFPGMCIYAMSKAAVAGLTRGLARDLGTRGITVNAIQPGSIDTDMNPANGPYAKMMEGRIALGRYGKASEIASMVAFLASAEADYITGASLVVDGGYTI